MKRFRLAAVFCCGRGALVAAILAAAPLLAAPKTSKEPKKPAVKPAPAAPATPKPKEEPATAQTKSPAAADDLYEGTAPRPKPVAPSVPESRPDTSSFPGPKFADAWPSEYRKPETDLVLTSANKGRADAMAEYVRARQADRRGDADVAIEAWKRAASLDPENAELAIEVARELNKRNEPGEAIRILKDSISAAPKDPRTHIYLGQIYAKQLNKPDLAASAIQKAIDVNPDDFRGWQAMYDFYLQAGEGRKATDLLDRALKSTTKNPEYWLRLGRKLSLKADGKPSPDELRQMETAYRRAAELKPDDASVLTQAGDYFAIAGNHKEALSFYERATKLNQPPRDEITRNLPEKYAELLDKEGRKAEALAVLEKLASDTRYSLRRDLYWRLGKLYEEAGQVDKAIEHFRQTLVLDTVTPDNHFQLATVQMRAKRFDDMVQTMEAARKKFRDDPTTTHRFAIMLGYARRYPEALAMYDATAEMLRGRNEGALTVGFMESWAAAADRAGKLEKAEELLKKCMADFPEAAGPYNDLGYVWVVRGKNLEEAGEMIKKAVEMDPKNPAYLDSLGWYYFKTGKFDDAKRELLNALAELKEEDATILEHLGDVYEKLGGMKEAVQYWERASKLEPEDPEKLKEKLDAGKKKLGA